jgi:hypothetical protein
MRKPNGQSEFWAKVVVGLECWHWSGRRTKLGYGQFDIDGRTRFAHRLAWSFSNGEAPRELDVLHKCDNPACVNPKHLMLGTHLDNMRDKVAKGRQPRGEQIAHAKLTEDQVKQIKAAGRTVPRQQMAERFGVNRQAISNILCGRKWKHVAVE